MTAQDIAALGQLLDMPHDEHGWVASELPLASEWRYCVLFGEVIGYSPITRSCPAHPSPIWKKSAGS